MRVEAAMTKQALTLALGLGLVASGATADNAKPRGSGGGGGSSSAGVRHHSPSGGSGSSASGGSSSGGSSSSSSGLSQAERRHPRAGTGRGGRYSSPYYYYPGWGYWYSPGYWPGYYYGYSPYWGGSLYYGTGGYGYYGGGYYGSPYVYRSHHASDAGALRILVDPEDTKVYVDGYYAGEVDDFDGMFQRLYVSSGRHEVTLKRDGYITHRIRVYVGEDVTLKLRHEMEKGSGPDTLEDLAGEQGLYEERRPPSHRDDDSAPESEPPYATEPPRREQDRNEGPMAGPGAGRADASVSPGLLSLAVNPDDASVYVDGRFFGSARQTGEIELAAGPHRVEIVRPGYRTVDRRVVIEAGRMETLAIALERP